MNIPDKVKEEAMGLGDNINIEYLGKYNGEDVFSVGFSEECDTGMPILVIYNGEEATLKIDDESLDIFYTLTAS